MVKPHKAVGKDVAKLPRYDLSFKSVFMSSTLEEGDTLEVCHAGAATLSNVGDDYFTFNGVLHGDAGPRLLMTNRTTFKGDSGGPVFTRDGQLVGFVSEGMDESESTRTVIVMADQVFAALGVSLYVG